MEKLILSFILNISVSTYKDYWTFPGNTSFRGKNYITGVIFSTFYAACFVIMFKLSESGKYSFTDVVGFMQLPMWLLIWGCIKNSFQHFARYETYWVSSFFITTTLLGIFHVEYEVIGEFNDLLNVEVMFWTYLIVAITLIICKFMWKRKVLHGIPQEFCNGFMMVAIILMIWSPEGVFDPLCSQLHFSIMQIGLVVVLAGVIVFIVAVLYLQRARLTKVTYYYECFYRYAEQNQKHLGILRHEFANHREVLRYLPEDSGEKGRYKEKLDKIYEDAKLPEITGILEVDRFLNIFLELAEMTGHSVEICWETDRKEIPEKWMKSCIERLCILPKKSYIFWFGEYKGKSIMRVRRKREKK